MIYGLRASHSFSHNIHLQVTDSNLQEKNMCVNLPIGIYKHAYKLPQKYQYTHDLLLN